MAQDLADSAAHENLWTYDDVAQRWRVSPRQVKRRIAGTSLRPMDLGHRTKRFRPADVLRFEEELASAAAGAGANTGGGRFSIA